MAPRNRKSTAPKTQRERRNERARENARAAAGESAGRREEYGPFAPADHPVDERGDHQRRYQPNETDRFIVSALAQDAVPHEVIARVVNKPHGISVDSLRYHFERELLTGRADLLMRAHVRLAATLNDPGHKDSAKVAMFFVERLGREMERKAAKKDDGLVGDGTLAHLSADIIQTPGKISFTLKIGENEPLDDDKIGTRTSLDEEDGDEDEGITDVHDLNEPKAA